MGKMYRRSGQSPESTHPSFSFILHAFGPAPGEKPWWARLTGQRWTHMALQVGDYIWHQPFRGEGSLYEARPYLAQYLAVPRYWSNIHIDIEDDDVPFDMLMAASKAIAKRKGQPIRSILRYCHLWPWPAWNCIGPARYMLSVVGIDTKKETPDGVVEEIFAAIQTASRLGACEQDSGEGHSGLDGNSNPLNGI
jgi:hypothetical protein